MQDTRREIWFLLESDQIVMGVHPRAWCSGACVIHSPSAHWMREYPLSFDYEAKAFVRTCPHGHKHQDPDERTYWTTQLARSMASKRSGAARKLESLAQEKLSEWACPYCSCSCCDVTKYAAT